MLVFLAGVRLREVAALLGCVAVALPLVWANLHGYMRDRVLGFVRPGSDPEISYVMDQALISIGSGAIWGKGYASGSQSQLHFLRVRHTDFIFSVIGEELGFVGAVLTLGLLAFICYRIFRIGQTAPDTCGRLVACGVGTVLAFQTLVNAGMNTGLLPVTGLPLPFISRGGSALLAQLIGIGLVESVALRRRLPHV
jgi:rod shape determining protein RodA